MTRLLSGVRPLLLLALIPLGGGCKAQAGASCRCGDECRDGLVCAYQGQILDADACLPTSELGECVTDESVMGGETGLDPMTPNMDMLSKLDLGGGVEDDTGTSGGADTTGTSGTTSGGTDTTSTSGGTDTTGTSGTTSGGTDTTAPAAPRAPPTPPPGAPTPPAVRVRRAPRVAPPAAPTPLATSRDHAMSEASSPEHDWLTRHDASAWLAAARHELAGLPTSTVTPGARRKAVTILRRGAGMALNGALMHGWRAGRFDLATAATRWGRSYMDHLRALAGDATWPLGLRRATSRGGCQPPLQPRRAGW